MKITRRQLKLLINEIISEDKSGEGACPKSGCIEQRDGKWRIISNKDMAENAKK